MKKLFFLLSVLVAVINAQSGGTITGTVKDPQGKPVPGTTLTLFSTTGAVGSATTSDVWGSYRFEGLPAGDYLLRAVAPRFAIFVAGDIHLSAGATETRDVALQIAGAHEEVVVTASGTPQAPEHVSKATTVIDQADADARDDVALSDVVALTPGVRVQQLGGPGAFTTIQIRGLRTEDTAVLVDGLRLRDASATQADASGMIEDLLFTDANSVEVMRGSGSSLYGTNAIGGVINVITDQGGGRTRGNLLIEGGSLDAFRGRAQLAGGFLNDRIQYSFGAAEMDVPSGVGGDSPFRDTSTQGRVTFHLSPSIRLTARLYGANSFGKVLGEPDIIGTPSGLGIVNAVGEFHDFHSRTRQPRFHARRAIHRCRSHSERPGFPALDYSISYQLISNGRRYGDGPAGVGYQPDGSTRSLYDGRIQTVDAQIHYRLGRFNLLSGGYEFENENYANDNSDQSNPASDVRGECHATEPFRFCAGPGTVFRRSSSDFGRIPGAVLHAASSDVSSPWRRRPIRGSTFPSPTAAYTGDGSVAYFFRKTGTKLRAHVGRGYRAPSLFERFGAGFDPVFGYSVYGDPRLKPEHSTSLDAGFDQTFFHGRVKASASYFYTWLQDVINFDTSGLIDPATDPFGRYVGYINTQGGISRGVEVSASIAPTRSLNVTTAYTYVNAIERIPIVGDVLQTFVVPRNQFSILVTEQPTSRLLFTFDTLESSSYLDPVYGDTVTQTYRFNGIHKVNAGASYRIPIKEYEAIRFFVRADNILNQTYYESGFLTPGRTASGGMQFEF